MNKMKNSNCFLFSWRFMSPLKRTLFLMGLAHILLFAPSCILGRDDVLNKPSVRVIYGGGLFGTLEPCG